jgi:hypothetical protein
MLPRCVTSRKAGYVDEPAARVALADCIAGRRTAGHNRRMERDVYLCESCGLWHLTKKPDDPLDAEDLQPLVVALRHRFR